MDNTKERLFFLRNDQYLQYAVIVVASMVIWALPAFIAEAPHITIGGFHFTPSILPITPLLLQGLVITEEVLKDARIQNRKIRIRSA